MNRNEKRRQIVYSVVMIICEVMGIRAVAAMLNLIGNYSSVSDQRGMELAISLSSNYCLFVLLLFVCFILSIRAKRTAAKYEYIGRNICFVLSAVIASSSSIAVLMVFSIEYAKYINDMSVLNTIYNLEEVNYLISNPHEFYLFMVGVVICLPFAIKAIIDVVNAIKNR